MITYSGELLRASDLTLLPLPSDPLLLLKQRRLISLLATEWPGPSLLKHLVLIDRGEASPRVDRLPLTAVPVDRVDRDYHL